MSETPQNPGYTKVEVLLPTGESRSFVPSLTFNDSLTFTAWDTSQDPRKLWIRVLCSHLDVHVEQGLRWSDDFWLSVMQIVLERQSPETNYKVASFEDGAKEIQDQMQSVQSGLSSVISGIHSSMAKLPKSGLFPRIQTDLIRTFAPATGAYTTLLSSLKGPMNAAAQAQKAMEVLRPPNISLAPLPPSPQLQQGSAQIKALHAIANGIDATVSKLDETIEVQRTAAASSERWAWIISILTLTAILVTIIQPFVWRIVVFAVALVAAFAVLLRGLRPKKQ